MNSLISIKQIPGPVLVVFSRTLQNGLSLQADGRESRRGGAEGGERGASPGSVWPGRLAAGRRRPEVDRGRLRGHRAAADLNNHDGSVWW